MRIYKCEKCGSTDVFIECNENHRGLYCGDCGEWIKWSNIDEERLALRQLINQQSKNKNEEKIRADARTKTIEEFARRLKLKFVELPLDDLIVSDILKDISRVAEQMKGDKGCSLKG